MNGHGEKRTRKQELALSALLTEPTIDAAAVKVGIGEATLRRWLQDLAFQEAYRAARRQVVEAAVTRLQQATGEAVETLRRNLTAESPGVQVRAALGILDQAFRGAELLDLAERMAALEARLASQEQAAGPLRRGFAR